MILYDIPPLPFLERVFATNFRLTQTFVFLYHINRSFVKVNIGLNHDEHFPKKEKKITPNL